MSEVIVEPTPDFSINEIVSAAQFIEANETELAGIPGELKARFEDLCAVELGIPTREQASELWDAGKKYLLSERNQTKEE